MCRFSLSERDRSASTAMSGHVFQGRRGVKVWALLAHMSRRLLTLRILCNSCIAMVVYSSRMAVSPTRVMKSRGSLNSKTWFRMLSKVSGSMSAHSVVVQYL